jgi:hypothetical protein
MTGYTKLFGSIVASTIWRESKETKIVWITMLALADAYGIISASIPGLADLAKVTISECEEALQRLMSPDPYSRTKDFEGRRIEEVEGGWRILNYVKYRNLWTEDDRRAYKAKWDRENRNNRPNSRHRNINRSTPDLPPTETDKPRQPPMYTDTDTDTDTEEDKKSTPIVPLSQAEEIYQQYPKKANRPSALKAIEKALKKIDFDTLLAKTKAFANARNGDLSFCKHPATWFNGECFNDDPSTWVNGNHSVNGHAGKNSPLWKDWEC